MALGFPSVESHLWEADKDGRELAEVQSVASKLVDLQLVEPLQEAVPQSVLVQSDASHFPQMAEQAVAVLA